MSDATSGPAADWASDDVTLPFREAVAEAERLIRNPPFEISEQDLAE